MSSDKKIMKVEESTSEIEDLKQSVEALKTVSTVLFKHFYTEM